MFNITQLRSILIECHKEDCKISHLNDFFQSGSSLVWVAIASSSNILLSRIIISMHFPGSMAAIGLYTFGILSLATARDCFVPNGTIHYLYGRKAYVPCGPDDGTHTGCCAPLDGCSTTGLCFGSAGYMYRGGCTDATWTSENCAQHCQKGTNVRGFESNFVFCFKFSLTLADDIIV